MDDDSGGADDHGSGWLEVKKRHRATAPKVSAQNVTRGKANVQRTHHVAFHGQKTPIHKYTNQHHVRNRHPLKDAHESPADVDNTSGSSDHCHKRSVPEENTDCISLQVAYGLTEEASRSINVLDNDNKIEKEGTTDRNLLPENMVDMVSRIKWGDLDIDTLAMNTGPGSCSLGLEVNCSDNSSMTHIDEEVACSSKLGNHLEEKKVLVTDSCSKVPAGGEELIEGKEVSYVVKVIHGMDPKTVASNSGNGVDNVLENSNEPCGYGSDLNPDGVLHNEDRYVSGPSLATDIHLEGIGEAEAVTQRLDASEAIEYVAEVTVVSTTSDKHDLIHDSLCSDHATHLCSSPCFSHDVSCFTGEADACVDHGSDKLDAVISSNSSMLQRESMEVNLSNNRLIDGTGKNETGESKERFRQRLWCFLFENLNRAVDELYLLCELECDMEQMDEAILVLEEAESDLRELKSRVERFETTKKLSSQLSTDAVPGTLRMDHRRPHALSWEVRRMTTSPHRAEILSSSLEAFKKIQMGRAGRNSLCDSKRGTSACASPKPSIKDLPKRPPVTTDDVPNSAESGTKSKKQHFLHANGGLVCEKQILETRRKTSLSQNSRVQRRMLPSVDSNVSLVNAEDSFIHSSKVRKDSLRSDTDINVFPDKDTISSETVGKCSKPADSVIKGNSDKEKDKKPTVSWKSMDAWKEKRNWEDILASPKQGSSRVSHSPGFGRRSMERARGLHDKLMSPERKKKSALDLKREAEEKHARAMKIRLELENERVQRLQRTSEKLIRVNELQAVRSSKMREGMYARHQRGESRHEAYLAEVARRAGDESSKVNEVRFITSLNEENKKFMLRQKLHDSEMRRAEKLQMIKSKQKEDLAREEAVLERRKLLEAEKLQRLAEIQRKKEEAQLRREEERKASSAAREARAVEQLRRKEVRAKAQLEEAELLAQKLSEKLKESELRRKLYLEQIREKASMDYRDQSSPSLRRSSYKEGQGKSTSSNGTEEYDANCIVGTGVAVLGSSTEVQQHSLKRRIKKIRQRLMALKYEFTESPDGAESAGIGSKAVLGAARAKISRWIQELQRLRQARKEGATSIGLTVGEIIKFLDGKESELHASRQAGLLDFISSALPASHTSKPDSCQVTISLLQLLHVLLYLPANRSYFLAQNFLPPIIPLLSSALENYIKIAASLNVPRNSVSSSTKTSTENLEPISAVLEGFLWSVTSIMGHTCTNERQLKMWDGLLDLIVSYRIIHHLRDFFSLYDRPQVEGSPFASPILLGLNLLAVLTSKCRIISSIDWETDLPNSIKNSLHVKESIVHVSNEGSPFVVQVGSGGATLPQEEQPAALSGYANGLENPVRGTSTLATTQDDAVLEESIKMKLQVDLLPSIEDIRKDLPNVSVKSGNSISTAQVSTTDFVSKSQSNSTKEIKKPLLPQKNEKLATENSVLQKTDPIMDTKTEGSQDTSSRQAVSFLVSVIAETGLVSLPSLLTAVLLQANNHLSSEQGSYILPSNFEAVATGVLKVLNNLALIDITLLQTMLARPDLQMEFFHLMSFLLSHCTNKWNSPTDQVGLLLLETLRLLDCFALFHTGNQAVLRWGKSPTILHKVCDLPFVFFSDPDLTPILAGTLVAACYGSEQNRAVVQQELSLEMLLSLLKSCRPGSLSSRSDPATPENLVADDAHSTNHPAIESRKLQADNTTKASRCYQKCSKAVSAKGGLPGGNGRTARVRTTGIQRDARGAKGMEPSPCFILHSRFPSSFLDKAEEFFSAALPI